MPNGSHSGKVSDLLLVMDYFLNLLTAKECLRIRFEDISVS